MRLSSSLSPSSPLLAGSVHRAHGALAVGARALVVAIVCTLAGARPSHAQRASQRADQAERYARRVFDRDGGLPEAQVNAIARTPDGYLWLGTRRGLVRFDGVAFTSYSPENAPGLPDFWINGLTTDRRGRLWIATPRGLGWHDSTGFHRIDRRDGPSGESWRILEDRRGRLWVATDEGVYRSEGTRFRLVPGLGGYAYALAEDREGGMWISGRDLLARSDGDRVEQFASMVGLRGRLFDVLADPAGGVWVGTIDGAVRVERVAVGRARKVEVVSTRIGSLRRPVWALGRSPNGLLWLGTENAGTLQWDGRTVRNMSPGPRETWTFFVDPRGTMWAGTGAGLERYVLTGFSTLSLGRDAGSVWSARVDGRGVLWAGTGDGALHRWAGTRFDAVLPPNGTLSPPVWPTGEGVVVAEGSRRLLQLGPGSRRQVLPAVGLPPGDVLGLFEDARGGWWVSADSGLFHVTGGRAIAMNPQIGYPGNTRPREMARDRRGRLLLGRPWLTVVDGTQVRRFDARDGLTDSVVRAIHPRGRYTWLGTADSGLFVLHDDRITRLGHLDPALRREVLGIADDGLGSLWLSWSYGLTRVRAADLEAVVQGDPRPIAIRTFDQSDGLPSTAFQGDFQSAISHDAQGRLLFPNTSGIVRVDPREVRPDTIPPQVLIERITVDGRVHPLHTALQLPSGVGRVAFTFAATDAARPTRLRVQYRLHGADSAWIEAGARRTADFGPLRGGRYRFEVRAVSDDGQWNRTPAAATIDVALALPEHQWFLPLLLGTTAGLVLLLARARQRALLLRSQQLTRLVDDRTADLQVARATLERRVEERTAELAEELAERKRLESALVESQKLEGLGRLAGGVAHEINNSMTTVLGFADLAAEMAEGNDDILRELTEVRRGGERVATITRQLLLFARQQHGVLTAADPGEILGTMTRSLQQVVGADVELAVVSPAQLPHVRVDRGQMEQVLINLVRNARDATRSGGRISVSAAARRRDTVQSVGGVQLLPGDYVVLSVEDSGAGMSDEVRRRIFEPFFTTKGATKGTGLGLAVCHGIVVHHGGAIEVSSTIGVGTRFDIWLPVHAAEHNATVPVPSAPSVRVAESGTTLLVVDDEPTVRELVRRHLTNAGFEVLTASDGAEALQRVADHGPVDVLLTDYMMPEMDGLTLATRLREDIDDLPVIFISGFSGLDGVVDSSLADMGSVLGKPFTRQQLLSSITEALDRRTTRRTAAASALPGG